MKMKKTLMMMALMMGLWLPTMGAGVNNTEMETGSVSGRVTDDEHQVLPGATVMVEETKAGTVSDVRGYYSLPGLRPGRYTLRVSYVGYKPRLMTVNIPSNKTVEMNVELDEGAELQAVEVTGAFRGQRRALQMQKSAMGITNVVSADRIGKFPDSNIGDALKRINGVSVQYDQGEARFGGVRGTGADFTSVAVDGNRLPSAESETRNVQLDLIPADMIQTIELNKVVTADMDGDAIGGEINLITKNTPSARVLNFTAGTGWSAVSSKPLFQLGATWGDRFFNNKLGVMLAAGYQYNPAGSDNVEYEYEDNDDRIVLKEAQERQYYVTRQRQSYSAALDYRFDADHKLTLNVIYNRRHDWENRYRISYKKLSGSAKKQSLVLQTKGGDDGGDRNCRLELQQTLDMALGGEHRLGSLEARWKIDYAMAGEDRPNERYFAIKQKGLDLNSGFADVGSRFPYYTLSLPVLSDGWEIDEVTNSNEEVREREWKARLDFKLPLGEQARWGMLRFGAKYAGKKKRSETHNYDYTAAIESLCGEEWMNNTSPQIRSGFMPGNQFHIGTPFVGREYLGGIDFSALEGSEILEDAAGNFDATERVSSGYLRYDKEILPHLLMTAGLRLEHTDLKYSGYRWAVDANENETLTPTGEAGNHYNNWLPSLILKYNATNDLVFRASFTETLSRPKYRWLVPSVSYNAADEEASVGNPALKPTTSFNFDLAGEYYFKQVGLVSLGLFYKNIHNVFAQETWTGTAGDIAGVDVTGYDVSQPNNCYDADLFGVELAYERDFGFIAPALRCLGLYATYTYTTTRTKNYAFAHRQVADGESVVMVGTPNHAANVSLYFDKWGLNLRLSYNMASSFIDEYGKTAALDRYYDGVNYLDLNASYTWGKTTRMTVFADVTNILNQPLRYYQGTKNRTCQAEYYGARMNVGIKINL